MARQEGGGRGPQMLTQKQHLGLWMRPNPNKEQKTSPTTSHLSFLKLREMGIEEEELTAYNRSIISMDDFVNDQNDLIVRALNEIALCRREYFLLRKNRAPKKSVNSKLRSISDLKRRIKGVQVTIEAAGGVSEKIPRLFERPVSVSA